MRERQQDVHLAQRLLLRVGSAGAVIGAAL
jgi:hypothetical protein